MAEHRNDFAVPPGLRFMGRASWEQVKAQWKSDEDTDAFRREYAQYGFSSWETWRSGIIEPLQLEALAWRLYEVSEPSKTVPEFRGGPFKSWEERYYGGKKLPTFAEIVTTEGTDVHTRGTFKDIIAADAAKTFIGLILGREVYILEGMHRATSIALAAHRGQPLHAAVRIYLARSRVAELKTLSLKRPH